MDAASDRINGAQVSTLRQVKDRRERRALSEWQGLEARRRMAATATLQASQNLAAAEADRARLEAELYEHLLAADALSVVELDHCRLIIEKRGAAIAQKRQLLDQARVEQEKAEAAAAEGRARWARCSVVAHKWGQIEIDVRCAADARAQTTAEREIEDDISLRYGLRVQAAAGVISNGSN
jgi:hypothetical protein